PGPRRRARRAPARPDTRGPRARNAGFLLLLPGRRARRKRRRRGVPPAHPCRRVRPQTGSPANHGDTMETALPLPVGLRAKGATRWIRRAAWIAAVFAALAVLK